MILIFDASDLVKIIKKSSVEAVEANKPVNILFGKVISISPLKINVDQKMTLSETQLILTRNVTEYESYITIDHETEPSLDNHSHDITAAAEIGGEPPHLHEIKAQTEQTNLTHTHKYRGKFRFVIDNSLAAGDHVILLRQQNGQKFIVLDRII